ncbi:MAG: hypothetical protein HY775_02480 [Acidobacteria bacterium]|nr:hypothetical protein [Acidobacteriota bacterium]
MRIGEAYIAKLTQTVPIGKRHEDSKRPPLPLGQACRLGGLQHRYAVVIGDAQGTHIEVSSPDTAAVRLKARNTEAQFGNHTRVGPVGLRDLFGIEYSESYELQVFYTTKTRAEFQRLIDDLNRQPPAHPKGWMRLARRTLGLPARAITHGTRRLRARVLRRVPPAPTPDPSAKTPKPSSKTREIVRLQVFYKLKLEVAALYVAGAAFAAAVTAILWWAVLSDTPKLQPNVALALSGLAGPFSGFLAVRERATVAGLRLLLWKGILFACICGMLAAFALGALTGDFGPGKASDVDGRTPPPGQVSAATSSRPTTDFPVPSGRPAPATPHYPATDPQCPIRC